MKYPQHTILIFLIMVINCGQLFAQEQSILIDNPDADTLFYCGIPVAVAPGIIIENFDIEEQTDGIKISIVNYVPGEDVLFYTGNAFEWDWDADLGNLEITGQGTAAQLQEAVRNVFYENTSGVPSTEFRSISISLLDADFLPESGHFYQFIPQVDITWSEARDEAAGRQYYGLQGYLATITSPAENDFIWSKVDGLGWIGATDEGENEEGTWRWATGPEANTVFWQGGVDGQPVNGNYSNWSEGEPNDNYGEDYAHINQDPNKEERTWNDLRNGGDGIPGSAYRSQGYVVEYGGMPGDPEIKLSASAVVGVNQVPEFSIEAYDTLICGERQRQITIQVDQEISVIMRPLDANSAVRDSASLTPTVEVQQSGNFRFELELFNEDQCSWFDTISITFQNQPVAELNLDEASCVDYDLQLSFTGEAEDDALFEWYSNDTVFASGTNMESVEIPLGKGIMNRTVGLRINENGCVDSVRIPVTVKPEVIIQAERPEGCVPLNVQFNYTATEPTDEQLWRIGPDNTSTVTSPSFTFDTAVAGETTFDVSLNVVSAEGCASGDTVKEMIRLHPDPTVDLDFDESVCHEGNEEIWYKGNAGARDTFLWDLSGISSTDVVKNPGNTEGPLQLSNTGNPLAEIGIQVVTEFGCKSDTLVKTFKRKPSFSIPQDTLGGCPPFEAELSVSTSGSADQVDYLWDFGNGQTAGGNNVSQVYTGENQYFDVTVSGVSSLTGCSQIITVPGKVFVYPVPEASFTADPVSVLAADPEVTFFNSSTGASAYEWDFGDGSLGSTIENPVHSYENLGIFDITLLAINEYECIDSASAQVSVTFDKLFPPTAFSPNAPREEDRRFRIFAEGIVKEGYNLLIFNRWGEVVFSSGTPDEGWDGKMKNGSNAPPGAYFWVLEYLDLLGEEHVQKGSLTLLY